jgi:hypothetical protein
MGLRPARCGPKRRRVGLNPRAAIARPRRLQARATGHVDAGACPGRSARRAHSYAVRAAAGLNPVQYIDRPGEN